MRRKCIFYYLVLSALVFFLFVIAVRKPLAADKANDTPGCLTAMDKTGKLLGSCPRSTLRVKADITGVLARVTVCQEFQNLYREPI